jgi:uncharacterized protein
VIRRALLPALAGILLAWAAAAALTFPALTGRVVDEAGLLNAAERTALAETLAGLEAKTTHQLVVVTLKSLQGTSIEDYGYQLGRTWQIGQQGKDNGALLIVAPNERQVRIEVGYGLEGALTDALTRTIIETAILPRFRTGDFTGGINGGVASIAQVLTGDTGGWQPRAGRDGQRSVGWPAGDSPVGLFGILGVLGVGLLIFCAIRGGFVCQMILLSLMSGRGSSGRGSGGRSGGGFRGGGGSFGGGGASGRW